MSAPRRWRRRSPTALGVALVLSAGACAGDADDAGPRSPAPDPSTTTDPARPTTSSSATGVPVGSTTTVALPTPISVSIAVAAPGGIDARLTFEHAADGVPDLDPFGRFATCSGLRSRVAAYSVAVADPDGDVRSLGVLSDGPVSGPGTYDADVRVEPVSGAAVVATGTITIGADLRSGEFVAFDAAGGEIAGSFACEGPGPAPVPLAPGAADGVLETVEVIALLRRGDAERVVDVALDAAGAATDLACPGVEAGGEGPRLLVGADGEPGLGSIVGFELGAGALPALSLRVGGARYEIAAAEVDARADGASASFRGVTDDGVVVTGAYRCT